MTSTAVAENPVRYTRIDQVVSDLLCHRCGVCGGTCPKNAIEFGPDAYPSITDACVSCGLCAKVCSGWEFPLVSAVRERQAEDAADPALGRILHGSLCSSTNFETRVRGASGGVATQLLAHLLDTGAVKGALVCGKGPDAGMPTSRIATTVSELLDCSGSHYCLFPWGTALRTMLSAEGPFAVVGLPCHLHSLSKAMKCLPSLRDKIGFTVGLFCAMNVEPDAVRRAMQMKRVPAEDVDELSFRHGLWPGRACLRLKNGHNVNLFAAGADEASEFISYLKWCFGQRRCLMCPDYLAALGDVSLGDPWIRGPDGRYAWSGTEGLTITLCRTQKGLDCIRAMVESGQLDDRNESPGSFLRILRERATRNRWNAIALAEREKAGGRAYFDTDHPDTQEFKEKKPGGLAWVRLFDLLHIPLLRQLFLRAVFSEFGAVVSSLNIWRKRLTWRLKARRFER
ncbi:MAG: Coenzyme F420 hydrogenase/dehydrogenase, beta subunit C-terminal domain [Lentisphaerae bacterium]|nr:Coenzyme F420 hydrogenase/dehydrogenase, beta subunit C-terminal domain [Lentisphaerota bacterium]